MHWQRQLNAIQHLRKFISLNPVINNSAHINLDQMRATKYIYIYIEHYAGFLKDSNSDREVRIQISASEIFISLFEIKQIKTCYYLPLTAFNLFPTICFATKDAIVGVYLEQKLYFIRRKNASQMLVICFHLISKGIFRSLTFRNYEK